MCVESVVLAGGIGVHFRAREIQMGDDRIHNPSPPSSSSVRSVDDDGGAACTGKSCQSCTAGVIADCVAVCCCPCAVVNLLTLAFVKLPWAVARRCLGRRRRKRRQRLLEEERRKRGGDKEGIWGNVRGGESEIVVGVNIGEELNDHFRAEVKGEDVWLELYELGHLGFGRVSFTEIPFQDKGGD